MGGEALTVIEIARIYGPISLPDLARRAHMRRRHAERVVMRLWRDGLVNFVDDDTVDISALGRSLFEARYSGRSLPIENEEEAEIHQ